MKRLLNASVRLPVVAGFMAVSLGFPALAQTAAVAPAATPAMGIQRTISVQGEAKGDFEPDQAVLAFSVVSHDKVLAEAKRANDEMLEKVVAVTKQFDIPKEKVVPSGVYISPEYNYNAKRTNGRPQVVGYTVSRSLRITTKDLARQEPLLSALVDIKIDQVNNVEFGITDPEKTASELRVKAFANAKARAAALAEAAGAKLGPALIITTNGGMDMPRPMMPMMAMAKGMNMAEDASVAPSLPGSIALMETVNVTFALE